jgi:hypothetical protein
MGLRCSDVATARRSPRAALRACHRSCAVAGRSARGAAQAGSVRLKLAPAEQLTPRNSRRALTPRSL